MKDPLRNPLDPALAGALCRQYVAGFSEFACAQLHDVFHARRVAIVGTGPSHADTKAPHDTVVSLNGAHWLFTPEAFHVGVTRDWTEQTLTMRIYPRGDEADLFLLSTRAWSRERTPERQSVCFPEPVPVRRLGSQPLAAWFAAAFGASELRFYGCDAVAGCVRNCYGDRLQTPAEHPLYVDQPKRVKHLIGDTPAYWHVSGRVFTPADIEGELPVVSTPWVPAYQQLVKAPPTS